MVFSSIPFYIFSCRRYWCYISLYRAVLRTFVLFVCSLLFYAWGEPVYITIMLFSTVFDYVNGLLLARFEESRARARQFL